MNLRNEQSSWIAASIIFLTFILPPCSVRGESETLTASDVKQYRSYKEEVVRSIEKMREPNGLVNDEVFVRQQRSHFKQQCHSEVMSHRTSPSNIGLDLINQANLLDDPHHAAQAMDNLTRSLRSIAALEVHPSGLFYSWYATNKKPVPMKKNVSSIDNIHLALGLWTVMKIADKKYPKSKIAKLARTTLKKMNFSIFATKSGMMGGNLSYKDNDWNLDEYRYDYLGSEARSLYPLTKALGLMQPLPDGNLPPPVTKPMYHEVAHEGDTSIMRTWDGGAFQLLLPQMLMGEDQFSPPGSVLAKSFDSLAERALRVSSAKGYPLPAIFTACDRGVGRTKKSHIQSYSGAVGAPEYAATANVKVATNVEADDTVSPHGIFMAATRQPHAYLKELKKMEKLGSLTSPRQNLYCPEIGFMDGFRVKGADAHEVATTQLSLDQGMELLALNHILSSDGQNASSRALKNDGPAAALLSAHYKTVDDALLGSDVVPIVNTEVGSDKNSNGVK